MTKRKPIIFPIILFILIILNIINFINAEEFNNKSNTFPQYIDNSEYLETEKLTYVLNNNSAYDSSITFYYYKSFDEARVIYSILYKTYDQSDTVTQIKDHLRKFIKEKGFSRYGYIKKDTSKLRKTDNNEIYVDYTVYVKFYK